MDLNGVPLCGSFSLVLDVLRGEAVADLGCNGGHYLRFCGPGSQGLDISRDSVAACRAQGLSAQQHDLNVLPLPLPGGAFGVVLLSHVLEHVHAPLLLLQEANRLLRPGGRLVLGLPIEDSLYSRLRMDYYGGPEGHLYSFSRRNLRRLLELAGFTQERFYLHLPILGFRPWPRLNRLVQRLPTGLLYQLSGACWCIARRVGPPLRDPEFSSYFREGA
ncbi:MAG: class I SAM-dependent methyltransferase [Myxococcales bacterium]|nr:class I SAM-dependent methyltransferase [Myxococcota bacterium]MDW8280997.1 class I SAM-dependent methyltransferase [Myxococcales bacterium]